MVIPAQRSFPYDGVGGDGGPYDSDYFSQIMQAMLGGYTRRTTAGILLGVGNGVQESLNVEETSPQSLGVLVREGWAMVNGRMYQATEDITVPIVQNNDPSLDDRIDSIIVRIDQSTPSGRLVALQGTVAAVPVAPTLTQNATIWEIRVANVTVQNGAIVITTADIDNGSRAYLPIWPLKNGGLGRTQGEFTAREILIGIGGQATWEKLTGCSVERTTAGAALAIGSWQTLELTEGYDPDGLITVASNQITFAKSGLYSVTCFHHFTNGGAGASLKLWRLRNVTDAVTLLVGDTFNAANASVNRQQLVLAGAALITAGKLIEIQVQAATSTTQTTTDGAVGGETPKSLQCSFHRWSGD